MFWEYLLLNFVSKFRPNFGNSAGEKIANLVLDTLPSRSLETI